MAEAARFKDVLAVQLDRLRCSLSEAHDNRVASLEQEVSTLRLENARLCEHISGFASLRTPYTTDNFAASLSDCDRDRSGSHSLSAEAMVRHPSNCTSHTPQSSPSRAHSPAPPAPQGDPVLLTTSPDEDYMQEFAIMNEEEESVASTLHFSSKEDAFGVEARRNKDTPVTMHNAPDLLPNSRFSLMVPGAVGLPCAPEVLNWQAGSEGGNQKSGRHSMGSRRGSAAPSPRVSFTENCFDNDKKAKAGRISLNSRNSDANYGLEPMVSRMSTMSKSSFVSSRSKFGFKEGLNNKLATLANERNSGISAVQGVGISRNTTRDGLHCEGQLERTQTNGTLATEARKHLEDGFVFEMWPVWTKKSQVSRMSVLTHSFKSKASMEDDELDLDSDRGDGVCLRYVMVHPSSLKRLFWDYLGVLLLIYDFCVVPLQLFDLPKIVVLQVMEMVTLLYWTLDFVWSFFTGYRRPEGSLIMQPARVAKHYMKTWMAFDIILLFCQWLDLLITGVGPLKWARVFRILRLARLARVRRNSEVARAIAYFFQSERMSIVFAIVRLMMFLFGVAHCIACCWYGLGSRYDADGDTWVAKHELERQQLSVRYATALHWSLTQFTGSTETDIYPENLMERVFTLGALLLGFLVSASVVSSITCSLTRLQIINATQATQMNMLKRYLFDNKISTKVALRVQRNAMYALDQQIRNTSEENIELLKLVSEPQRIELHYEIHKPILCVHRFFQCYDQVNRAAMKRVTHSCMDRLDVAEGDVLFSEGEIPREPIVYFLLQGKLRYMQDKYVVKTLSAGNWACGALPWTPWVHLGVLRALSECKILLLDATQFQSIAALFQTAEFYPRKYAEELVKQLNLIDKTELTDVQDSGADVRQICEKVFPQHLRPSDDASRSAQSKNNALLSRTMSRLLEKRGWRITQGSQGSEF